MSGEIGDAILVVWDLILPVTNVNWANRHGTSSQQPTLRTDQLRFG